MVACDLCEMKIQMYSTAAQMSKERAPRGRNKMMHTAETQLGHTEVTFYFTFQHFFFLLLLFTAAVLTKYVPGTFCPLAHTFITVCT